MSIPYFSSIIIESNSKTLLSIFLSNILFFYFICHQTKIINKMRKAFFTILSLNIIMLSGLFLNAQEQFDAVKLWNLKRVGAPEISPDGNTSAFTITEYDIDEDKSYRNIYLMSNESGKIRQITFTGKDNSPVWSPDGEKLAFVSSRDEGPAQLFILDLKQGGEAKKISDLPVGVYAPKWFPCGTKIAFGANILPDYNGDWDKLKTMIDEIKNSKVTAKVTENTMYRFWDRWLTDNYYPRLFEIEISSEKITDLMPETQNYFNMMGGVSYDISPDGNSIALSMNVTEPPYDRTNSDIFLLKTDGSGELKNITPDNPASDINPVFSSCGNFIAYGKQSIYHFYADRVVINIYDIKTGSHRELTSEIDLSCQQWFWSEDIKTIYFLAEDRAMKSIFSIPAKGGNHKELFRGGTNNNASIAGKDRLVFLHQSLDGPNEIYSLNLKKSEAKNLSKVNQELLSAVEFGNKEDVLYKGADGADVQMFIVYPPDYEPNKKYPTVFLIHGGPHGVFGDDFHFRWNARIFAAQGYVVAMPNFHGSTSFGQDFSISIHGNHADKPFRDIMKAADYLIEKGIADPNKMAATGGSYGGYMVSWIAGHTDRFACLINHAGVYDLHLQFASDYSGNREYQYGGTPFQNYEQLNKNNPSQFAENYKTPMMVIHGELDYRVPVAHAFLVYGIYKSMGLEARLVYFPDENHWILKPQNSIFWYSEFISWLDRYLK
jgi:dipeptidyl aminopeptidase/acylaminoacyl peptidase